MESPPYGCGFSSGMYGLRESGNDETKPFGEDDKEALTFDFFHADICLVGVKVLFNLDLLIYH